MSEVQSPPVPEDVDCRRRAIRAADTGGACRERPARRGRLDRRHVRRLL